MKIKLSLLLIITLGLLLRVTGLNWDKDQHLHPDERFLTMVTQAISIPDSLSGYLNTSTSPANPHNQKFDFYVYGTFPMHLVKVLVTQFHLDTYNNVTQVGRLVSALLDTSIIVLVFLITKRLSGRSSISLIASFAYALSALPIQLAHFYAVDTFLVFFLTAAFCLLLYSSKPVTYLFSGLLFGLALACKISGVILLPVVGIFFLLQLIKQKNKKIIIGGLLFAFGLVFALRFAYPYLFAAAGIVPTGLNEKVISNWRQLKSFDDPEGWFPPGIMWTNAPSLSYPFINLVLWGLGLPLALLFLYSFVVALKRKNLPTSWLPLLIILIVFLYQGTQYAMPMRYFYPMYPWIAVLVGLMFITHSQKFFRLFLITLFIWPIAFVSIYTRPHSRQQASDWMFAHLPPVSTLSCEHWDDCLPFGGNGPFTFIEYPLYNPDTLEKWQDMQTRLSQTQYLVLTSNRLYGSIGSAPNRYPQTSRFYEALFAGKLGFQKIAEFSSRPNLPIPGIKLCLTPSIQKYGWVARPDQECPLSGISFVDDYADETWTVYDHPKVIIFQRQAFVPTP